MTRAPLSRPRAVGLMAAVAAAGLATDRAAKLWAAGALDPDQPISLLGDWFQLRLVRNPGAAFSLGADFTVVFAGLAVAVLAVLAWWALRRVRSRWWAVLAGLGWAGVAGNLVDRLIEPPGPFRGHVVDFLSVRGFAVFNVADVCLTAAVGCVLVAVLAGWSESGGPARSTAAPAEAVGADVPAEAADIGEPAEAAETDGPPEAAGTDQPAAVAGAEESR